MNSKRQEGYEKMTEHNRRIIAEMSREKLLKIANGVGATFGKDGRSYGPEDLNDQKLRDFVLALTQGI